jgi:hypothetical protein
VWKCPEERRRCSLKQYWILLHLRILWQRREKAVCFFQFIIIFCFGFLLIWFYKLEKKIRKDGFDYFNNLLLNCLIGTDFGIFMLMEKMKEKIKRFDSYLIIIYLFKKKRRRLEDLILIEKKMKMI